MQIIIEPPADVTVWWYTPRKNVAQWYIQAIRPQIRSGERAGLEYCILSHLDGRARPQSVRYTVTPYCNLGSRYIRVFYSKQFEEACSYTRCVAAMAYRVAILPYSRLWWHAWSLPGNGTLEPFHAH